MIRALLKSLRRQSHQSFRALIVNCSPGDETSSIIQSSGDSRLIELEGQSTWYWGSAVRAGQLRALETAAEDDCVMTLNADVVLQNDALCSLLSAHRATGGGMVAASCRARGRWVDSGTQWRFQPLSMTRALHRGEANTAVARMVRADILTGRATLYSIRLLREVGLVDATRFPHYACDSEFSARAVRCGWKCWVVSPPIVETGLRGEKDIAPVRFGLADLWAFKSGINLSTRARYIVRTFPGWMVPTGLLAMGCRCLSLALFRSPRWAR